MKVVLLIETVSRELSSKFLLASSLLQKHNEVILGHTHELFFQLIWIKHDILFLTNADYSIEKVQLLKILKRRGTRIVLLENEGGVFQNLIQLEARLSKDILNLVDIYFTWGSAISEYVILNNLIDSKKIIISGNPFFDTLLPINNFVHNINNSKDNFLSNQKYILINTRFSLANEAVKGQYSSITTPEEVEFDYKLMGFFIDLALFLSKNHFVVFRPHPSENIHYYSNYFKNNDNILLTKENSAQYWILNCECLIHNGCTTGIEGVLAGKKVLSYMPIKNSKFDMYLPNSISIICTSLDEIVFHLNDNSLNFKKTVFSEESIKYINNFKTPSIPIIIDSIAAGFITEKYYSKVSFKSLLKIYNKALVAYIKHSFIYFIVVKFFNKYKIEHYYQESKRNNFAKNLIYLSDHKKYNLKRLFLFKYSFILKKQQ